MAYKSRRERRITHNAKVEQPRGPMGVLAVAVVKKKPKADESVEGKAARQHLGKRARGGRTEKRADGGSTNDDSGLVGLAPQFRRQGSVENRGIAAKQMALGKTLANRYDARDPDVTDEGAIHGAAYGLAGAAERAANEAENYPIKGYGPHKDQPERARGGSTNGRALDARQDANFPDGPDKVSKGRPERAVEMVGHRKVGGRVEGGSPDTWKDGLSRQGVNPNDRMDTWFRAPGTTDWNEIDDKGRASNMRHANDETGAKRGGRVKRAEGGVVPDSSRFAADTGPGMQDDDMPTRVEKAQNGVLTPAQHERFLAARKAGLASQENMNEERGLVPSYGSRFTSRLDAAGYPGFRKGGRTKRAEGGDVTDWTTNLGKIRPGHFNVDRTIERSPPDQGRDRNAFPVQPKATETEAKRGGGLTAANRRALPSSDFALPGKGSGPGGKGSGSFPIPDESHGRNALARASNASPAERATIERKVHAKFPGIKIGGK